MAFREFPGTHRFSVRKRLGAGAAGIIYEVWDNQRECRLALKTLHRVDPLSLLFLKNEFRSLADLSHPNLVTLHELISENDQWFFTMELVDGVDFLEWVNPAATAHRRNALSMAVTEHSNAAPRELATRTLPPPGIDAPVPLQQPPQSRPRASFDEARLRAALAQLAEAISALHEAGQIHRDLKPSNVLVSHEGRVVVCDFGLAMDLTAGLGGVGPEDTTWGTDAYCSPEQAAGHSLTKASDWYSVGIMLFEALTGLVPFAFDPRHLLSLKQRFEPPPPSEWVEGVPRDLDQLCADLVKLRWSLRPPGADVLRRLGGGTAQPSRLMSRRLQEAELVGREHHLDTLRVAWERVGEGLPVTVRVRGSSGMGKSVLARSFLRTIELEQRLFALESRCYERESLPYKAMDSAMDGMARILTSLGDERLSAALTDPADALALTRLFPVLRRVPYLARQAARSPDVPDAQLLRSRAFSSLRTVFRLLASERPVALFLDDLQWGDADSASLLLELLRPPNAPPLLLIACYRDEDSARGTFLPQFLAELSVFGRQVPDFEVRVGTLDPEESAALVRSQLPEGHPARAEAKRIAEEADGNPFFLQELVRALQAGSMLGARDQTHRITLEEALVARLALLPASARESLEFLSVAGHPVVNAALRKATGLGPEWDRTLTVLRNGNWVRTRGSGDLDDAEPFHDRIRETVVAGLDPERRRACHRELAHAMAAVEGSNPEQLVNHFLAAGEPAQALRFASLAAERAAQSLAFDRASRLFRLALSLHTGDRDEERELQVRLADTLVNGGRGTEAAELYLIAARDQAPEEQFELKRRATEQLLKNGHLDRGREVAGEVLTSVGMHFPRDGRRALTPSRLTRFMDRVLKASAQTRGHARPPSRTALRRIDLCWTLGTGLHYIDEIQSQYFESLHLLLALRSGEPNRIAMSMALLGGTLSRPAGEAGEGPEVLCSRARALATAGDEPYPLAMADFGAGTVALMHGRWKASVDFLARSEDLLARRCVAVTWELGIVRDLIQVAGFMLGRFTELPSVVSTLLAEADARADKYLATCLRTHRTANIAWLIADQPDEASRQLAEGMKHWSRDQFLTQHYWELSSNVQIDLYLGHGQIAWARLSERFEHMEKSIMSRTQIIRVECLYMRSRCALAANLEHPNEALVRLAEKDARGLLAEGTHYAVPTGQLILAAVARAGGREAEAMELLRAADGGFLAADMVFHAAISRRRLGELRGGQEGAAMVLDADAVLAGCGAKRPERMANVFGPGF